MLRDSLIRYFAAFALAALFVFGCSRSASLPTALEAILRDHPAPTVPAPSPDSPANAIRLFQWCWDNRDIARYREIFTDDYRFAFALSDSAGSLYRTNPWTREDELICAQNLFVGGGTEPPASSITLVFDVLITGRDFLAGETWPWHQAIQIVSLTFTVHRSDGSALQTTGGALFYVVRGDSALIPQELLDRGFQHDPNRWYIKRWEDGTDCGGGTVPLAVSAESGLPARALPVRCTTWGRIKSAYR